MVKRNIGPDEAILVLKGWMENKNELLLSAKMINFTVISKCQVQAVQGDKVTLWSVKGNTAVFGFEVGSEHIDVRYSRVRELKDRPGLRDVPEEKLDNSALMISLPLQAVDSSNPLNVSIETITLIEL